MLLNDLTKFEADGANTGGVIVNNNVQPVIDTSAQTEPQTGTNQDGSSSQAQNDEFLKVDTDKTGEVKKTEEELNKVIAINAKIQSNFDKEKSERLKIEAELKREREKNLTHKQLEELKQQELEQNLKAKEDEIKQKELQFNKTKLLYEKGWDAEFMDIVAGHDLESFTENCKRLQGKIDKFIEKKVNERIAKANPVPGSSTKLTEDVFTIDEINTLPNKNGQEWTNQNLDKLKKSIQYHNSLK